jgi:hypothetical protein
MAENESKSVVRDGAKEASHEDSILAVSRYSDGSPAQSAGFRSIDPEFTAKVSEHQLGQHAASAVDHAVRSRLAAADADALSEPVGFVKELKDAQEAAAKAAAGKAEKVQGV